MRLRSTCDRLRSLPLIPPLVQTPKSLISLALLAVSRRYAIRSNFSRPLVGRVIPEPRRLDHGRRPAAPRLLVLAGKIVFADRGADLLDGRQQPALGVPMPRRAAGYASTGRTQHRAPVRPAEVMLGWTAPEGIDRARL